MNSYNIKKNIALPLVIGTLLVCMAGCGTTPSGTKSDDQKAYQMQAEDQLGSDDGSSVDSNAGNSEGQQAGSNATNYELFGYDAEGDDVTRVASNEVESEAPQNRIASENTLTTYVSPIDFAALKNQNPDIYAWLSVPGTNISYPVCQNKVDDSFYLNHNSAGKKDVNGAIFTESQYNQNDFSDPVTIVYGHNMKSGKMFGYLEETFRDGLEGRDKAIIYLPNGEIHYKLFAALRVPSGHLLDGKNMYKEEVFKSFAREITGNKDMYSVIDYSVKIDKDDRLIILSTCVGGDPNQRYIVVGKRISEASTDPNRRMAEAR